MFNEFSSQVWTPSAGGVVATNNTDTSIDGSCKKIVWTDSANEYIDIDFTSVDLSLWEEISLYIYMPDILEEGNVFKITINSTDYNFTREELRRNYWNHVLFDCSSFTDIDQITITSLVDDLVLFVDYIGYRKVTYNCDVDIITALKNHISLDYGVSTTLSSAASIGATSISLTSKAYINDFSILEIDNGSGTTEVVELLNREGKIKTALTNSFASGSTVRVLCPIRGEDFDSIEPDPVCGVKIYDMEVNKQMTVMKYKGGSKIKEYLGALGVLIYIDCSSKKKLLQLAREFNKKYGREFQFLLDGEQVDIYIDSSNFVDDIIGNNARMAYFYKLEPQPYLLVNTNYIDDLTINIESKTI